MALYDNERLYSTLTELNIIPQATLAQSLTIAQKNKIPLGEVLLDKDLITDSNLGRIIADISSYKFIFVSDISIPDEVLRIVPEIVSRKNKIVAFKKDKDGLHLAMADPTNIQIRTFLEKKLGIPTVAYFSTDRDISLALASYAKDFVAAFDTIIGENIEKAKGALKAEPPIIKIVDTIISYAYQNKSSDIHIEPGKTYSLVRFRIDGILHDIVRLPLELHPRIVTRIKVLSKLRTDEHQAAQDGKLQIEIDEEDVDVRVSIVPITEGEKIVMRLLSARSRRISLTELGFSESDLDKVKKAYSKPYGWVLSTGPTGSGKTTTMYAILKLLNSRDVNIMTIEDPVEYEIEGINQIQVNAKTNLTFAEGLRSVVRQDPNIILVGEIRDEDTASIAVNAAMTGHLVLSTLHTNDAATTIPRLLDMKVEPFLIASSVNVIIAQRLVRRIHTSCRVSQEIDKSTLSKFIGEVIASDISNTISTIRTYKGKGCKLCYNTGYEGRIGIYEVLTVDDEIRQAIIGRSDATTIQKIAIKNGMKTMIRDGLEKTLRGVTTIDEVIRVTKE